MDNQLRNSDQYLGKHYRLTVDDLLRVLSIWDTGIKFECLLVACGGTALTLLNYKESTRDVDFLIPDLEQYKKLVRYLRGTGYTESTATGYAKPGEGWIFDLFAGQTVFQTELLDPIQEPENHRVIRKLKRITLAALTPSDLIISKMFRGDLVDVQDSVLMIKRENVDMAVLASRYRETASYYYNPATCKTNLGYLIAELEKERVECTALKDTIEQWTT
jgi:hypothetical protein